MRCHSASGKNVDTLSARFVKAEPSAIDNAIDYAEFSADHMMQ
jgi:hypothetical protein